MKNLAFILLVIILSSYSQYSQVVSGETQECLDCHSSVTPGIVGDWQRSLHSKSTIYEALNKNELERRISIDTSSELASSQSTIGCFECHSLNTIDHKDSFEHFGYQINVVVSPNDCRKCHPVEVDEYKVSKKANAHDNLSKNKLFTTLVNTITSNKTYQNEELIFHGQNDLASGETCYACHGTVIGVKGLTKIETDFGEIEVPELTNWPNQGVGRINPDGSNGACTSCHPRHSFSLEVARKPYTCAQCHLEPDVPAYNVYKESKHGNIFSSIEKEMNFTAVPWKVGKDITVPTCATCHNSLLVNNDGNIIAERTHDFGSRLWVRIFGLPYSHPQPKSGKTYEIKNSDGLQLPVNFIGELSTDYLLDKFDQADRMDKITSVCKTCHGTSWTEKQIAKIEKVNADADAMVLASTKILVEGWNNGVANNNNPFDENLEFLWQSQWLFYANSIRYSTAMMGPDYAGFKNGWFNMTHNLQKMKELIKKEQ
ncbi:MAG: hydroxylamine oxidase [Ignavibacteriae bacterium HGW-Ignavibacteriae-2]|jgi:hypothetical protein|nr:MAG: hydroxylamine oxidase [Ignavibacteriae bacterium HGW-Ignavibacteriae-2]